MKTMNNDLSTATIDSNLLSRVTGGSVPMPHGDGGGTGARPMTIRGQCGLPPKGGQSTSVDFHGTGKFKSLGWFSPSIDISGHAQINSDYKSCVDAVTHQK